MSINQLRKIMLIQRMKKKFGACLRKTMLLGMAAFGFCLSLKAETLHVQFPEQLLTARLDRLSELAGVAVTYDAGGMDAVRVPSLDARELTVDETLARTLAHTAFEYRKVADGSYTVLPRVPQALAAEGVLAGKIMDKDGFPIPGATVQILGTTLGVATDVKGEFSMALPAGRMYEVEVRCVSFQPMRISDIRIVKDKTTPLDVVLQEATKGLSKVVVTTHYKQASVQALCAAQKKRSAMTDGISSDLIKKTSDNNAAQVLGRLPGVTVNDGKFVTIRGLSERYNNVTINGASMPSTEPNRKNFAFDLIPTSLIDNIVVAKTFTPDMSAEFAGGGVEVRTLAIPERRFLNLSIGTGVNTLTTGKEFWSNERFTSDYFLGNSRVRNWMGRDWNMQWYNDLLIGPLRDYEEIENKEAVNRMNAAIPSLWEMHKFKGQPLQAYSFSAGTPFRIGEHQMGIVIGASYRHEEKHEEYGCNDGYDADRVQYRYSPSSYIYESDNYNFSTSIGAVANLSWKWRGQQVEWKTTFANRFTHENTIEVFETDQGYGKAIDVISTPKRNQVIQTRVEGTHEVWKGLSAGWYYDFADVKQASPDERNVRGSVQNMTDADGRESAIRWGGYMLGTQPGANDHIFSSELDEWKRNVGASLKYAFEALDNPQEVKFGYDHNNRDGQFMQYRLNLSPTGYRGNGEWGDAQNRFDIYDLGDYAPTQEFRDSLLYYVPWGENPGGDGYVGSMDIDAWYLMGSFNFWKNRIHLVGGVRLEKSDFFVKNYAVFNDTVSYTKKDWFPSVSLVGNVTEELNVRASYNKTIARFEFREVNPVEYYDMREGITFTGNDSLKNTYIDNYDLRVEWYPSAGEIISVTGFIKKFKHPIEKMVSAPYGNADWVGKPINLDEATGKGIEVNVRKSLNFIAPETFLKNIYVSANAMYMKMDVKYEQRNNKRDSVRNRPLQDLVPWSVNAGITYNGKIFGAALNYSTTGRKLVQSATSEAADEYEAGRDILDLQLSAKVLKSRMEIKFNASDLLAQPVIRYRNQGFKRAMTTNRPGYDWDVNDMGTPYLDDMDYNKGKDWLLKRTKKGSNFTLSVSYTF